MSEKYTPGPWQLSAPEDRYDTWLILCSAPHEVAHIAPRFKSGERDKEQEEANARRIVACVNACEGISTDELEEIASTGGMLGPREDVARIAKQRDELLAALKDLVCYDSYSTEYDGRIYDICPSCGAQDGEHKAHCEFLFARAAIAKATGEQA